jgi:asparagine synthase (glutamine-hydrolysing)
VVAQLPVRWAPKLAQLLQHTPYELETVWRDYRAFFADDEIRQLGHTPVNGDGPRTTDRGSRITSDVFWSVARLEMERFMSPQLLRDSDVFTMCHGLELRTPFVDDVFLKAVLDAGAWSRKGASSYKLALFKSMNGFLPTEHLAQRKRTFTLPFELWLREALMNQSGSDRGGHLRSVLGRSEYRPFMEGFVQGNVHWSRIWSLYVLERFRAGTVNLT